MKQFIKNTELSLQNGGYLCNAKGEPVSNEAFVQAQKAAEYVCTFAEMAKTKNFKQNKVDSLSDLKAEVLAVLNNKTVKFIAEPTPVKRELTDKLAEEAMSFINFQQNVSKTQQVNEYLQQFTILKEFEDFGLFFDQGVVKLNKLYTIEEVINAVESCIDLL